MVLAEAYTFHVHNLNEKDQDRQGAVMCVLFGIIMIYTGSLIIHLGPTLIGGHFQFNEDIGNCIFAYGQIKVRKSRYCGQVCKNISVSAGMSFDRFDSS